MPASHHIKPLPASPVQHRLNRFFETWASLGQEPTFIVDVGANTGRWSRLAYRHFPRAGYLLIEPQKALQIHALDLLRRPNVRWMSVGIGDQQGTQTLTVPKAAHNATFLPIDETDGAQKIEVPVQTLDDVLKHEPILPEMVKIDAEGYDLRVLRGAVRLLGVTDVVLVECAIGCRHRENTLAAVSAYMAHHGYRVFDFTDLVRNPANGMLWLAEVVFVRENSAVWGRLPAKCEHAHLVSEGS